MGYLRAMVSIPRDTFIPADNSVNTFHFETTGDIVLAAAAAHTKLETFYQAVDQYLSPLNGSPATVKYYDLEDPNPRVPIAQDEIVLTLGTTDPLPEECAIAMSYQADAVSGQSQARRRGRIFLGPLITGTGSSSGGIMAITTTTRNAIAAAAAALAGPPGADDASWAVFSPTTAGPEPWDASALADSFAMVTNGWVDNTYDTQRRRGPRSTTRTLWTS